MRILVTGATGLIGTHLLGLLLRDHEVHATTRSPQERRDPRAEWTRIDLRDTESVDNLVHRIRPTAICHLAGLVDGRRALDSVMPTLQTNVVATVALLEAAARSGCSRVVIAGSLVEAVGVGHELITPAAPYDASRFASSAYARMFHALFDLPVVTIRPSYVYGPHQRDESKLVPHVVTSLLANKSPRLSAGNRMMDWLYASDAASAFSAALTVDGIDGQTIDVSSGECRSVRQVVESIHTLVAPTTELRYGDLPPRQHDLDLVSGNSTTSRATLHWKPVVALEQGLEVTVDWFRAGCPDPALG